MASVDDKAISSMKVAELREELKCRGLDTKGTKAVLVKRLKEAIAADTGDTADISQDDSVLDTTTEMTDESMTEPISDPVPEPEPEPAQELVPEPEVEQTESVHEEPEFEEPVPEAFDEPQPEEEPEAEEPAPELIPESHEAEPIGEDSNDQSEPTAEDAESRDAGDVKPEGEAMEVQDTEKAETNGETAPEEKADIPGEFAVIDEVGETDNRDERRDRRRSRSRSPRRRSRSPRDRRDRRRTPPFHHRGHHQGPPDMESDEWLQDTNVMFDKYNSDLNLKIDEDNKCHPLSMDGFAFMWAGVRATYGVTQGKVAFQMKITENQNVSHLPEEEQNPHVVRVGYSTDASDLQLGEVVDSFGYGGTAKASENCKFRDYGETFGADDVLTSYVDFEGENISISYDKNGNDLGECFTVPHDKLAGVALFPHVLTKNCAFQCNFGQLEEPWFPLKEGFTFINDVPVENRVRGSLPPEKKEDCEMLMMCGLPGCGKTTWALKHLQENPDKKFYILGTNSIIDKMKVMGLPRKRNYAGRWDVLIDKSTKCLNKLFEIAARKKRNYILDQTNVYPSAQRRKMRPFEGFQRKAIVIVPTDEDFKARVEKREKEEGKDVPDKAVLEMKANFQIPDEGQLFDKVEFIELQREEAAKLVEEYNKEGRAACPPRERHNDRSQINVSGGRGRYDNRDRRQDYRRYDDHRGDRRYDDRRGGGGRDRSRGRDRDHGGRSGGYDRNRGYGRDDRRGHDRGYDRGYDRSYGSNQYSGSGWGGYNSQGGSGSWAGWNQQSWDQGYGGWGGYNQSHSQQYSQQQPYSQQQYQQYWSQYQQNPQQYNQWYYGQQAPKK